LDRGPHKRRGKTVIVSESSSYLRNFRYKGPSTAFAMRT
jgi:hypothetical protein